MAIDPIKLLRSSMNATNPDTGLPFTLRGYARKISVSPAYLSDVLKGKRGCGPAVLKALGLIRDERVTYRRR